MSIASSEQVKLIRQRCGNTYIESEWRQFLEDLKAEMSSLKAFTSIIHIIIKLVRYLMLFN